MGWAYPLFLLLLSGFGVVYLAWPVNEIAANYGLVAVNAGLILCSLALTRSAFAWQPGEWPRTASIGLSVGLWLWVIAGLLEAVDTIRKQPVFSGMSDFLWVTGYVPMFIGLFPRFQNSALPGKKRARIILLALAAGYCAVFSIFLLPRLMDSYRGPSAKALDVFYISCNFVLTAILLTISRDLTAMRSPLNASLNLLLAATVLMTGTDILLSYYTNRETFIYQLLDIPYFVTYFLIFQAGQEFVRIKRGESGS